MRARRGAGNCPDAEIHAIPKHKVAAKHGRWICFIFVPVEFCPFVNRSW